MRYIAAFYWTAAIDLAICSILQQRYINYRNIRVLAALNLAIAVLYKPTTINIPFCSILQRRYIKLPQYISFCGIFVTYSGGLDARCNRYFFAAFFLSYSSGLDCCNRPFNCQCLVQCIPLWPKCHFGFSFPSSFYFPMYPSIVSSKEKKNPLSLSLSLSLSLYKHYHHQSFTTSHH